MATKTKTKQKAGERPIVTFNKTGNMKAPGVNGCVWHSHITDDWKWEMSVGGVALASGRVGTREQAERAAARAIPALARKALRVTEKELARATKRHEDATKTLAGWL